MGQAISSRNPFQQVPQSAPKPAAQGPQFGKANPFQAAGSTGAAKPAGDAWTIFKSQVSQMNLNQPAPPQDVGRKLCVSG